MKTLVIDKDFKGLIKNEYGQYLFQGNIEFDGSIEIKLDHRLIVSGGIKAGDGIEAGWGIEAGEGIEAGWGIKAGLTIKCSGSLSFKFRLFAGIAIWKKTEPEEQAIECKEIDGEIGYGILKLLEGRKTK